MSEYYGLAGDVPLARKPLVRLEHEYRRLVQDAIRAALERTLDYIYRTLIYSAYSPVPKDTGFLRSQLKVDIRGAAGEQDISLWLSWEGVPYAEFLVEKAGTVNVRHAKDPFAENPWMAPAMRLVFPLVLSALGSELTARGIEFTQSW